MRDLGDAPRGRAGVEMDKDIADGNPDFASGLRLVGIMCR
jgi:hypothetical protein